MKIHLKKDAVNVVKPEGVEVTYHLFDEYEMISNVQPPHSTQVWHHHDYILETIIMTEGEMTVEWVNENGENKSQIIREGDLIESGNVPHNISNNTDKPAKFITLKQVLSGKNHRETFKTDKILE